MLTIYNIFNKESESEPVKQEFSSAVIFALTKKVTSVTRFRQHGCFKVFGYFIEDLFCIRQNCETTT